MTAAIYRPGRRVGELARPFRKGRIIAVIGIGENAVIIVALDGFHPASFRPSQLELL